MKGLVFGIVILVLIGSAGFLYRNALEGRGIAATNVLGCTQEVKLCPDGTAVGRSGAACSFAPCPLGNVEDQENGLMYALPPGYESNKSAYSGDPALIGAFVKGGASSTATILIRKYPIAEGETASDVMIANTTLEPSDKAPQDASAFTPKLIGTHPFSSIVIERFEGIIDSAYYLTRGSDVLRFDIIETGVMNWTSTTLSVDSLPEHQAFLKMLATLQVQ